MSRRKLGAKDVDDPPVSVVRRAPSNPYLGALIAMTSVLTAITLIFYLVGLARDGQPDTPGVFAAGTHWLGFAAISFLATMVVGGINWHLTRLANERKSKPGD